MTTLLWITKTAQSSTLSRSEGQEQLDIFSQAQTTSRRQRANQARKIKARSQLCQGEPLITLGQCHTKVRDTDEASNVFSGRHSNYSVRGGCNVPRPSPINGDWCSSLILSTHLERDCDWTVAERRSAVYFREVTIHQILTLQRDKLFWEGTVPCTAEMDSGIRHLVVAIAATSELLRRPGSSSLNNFALTQCNKALRAILSSKNMSQLSLITSCILVAAYQLLRSDVEAADKSVESGLNVLLSTQTKSNDPCLMQPSRILTSLAQQHCFKLWTADVTFQIDRTVAGHEDISFSINLPKGPFTNITQVLAAFKTLMVEFVAMPMRNLALGAHIDPTCLFAQDVSRSYSEMLFHWETFYHSLPDKFSAEKLQLIQLKIGLLSARLLFHTKLLASDEIRGDHYTTSYAEILRLGQEVIDARHAGRQVIYLDRIVNGALFTCSMFCREPDIKRRLIHLLKSQVVYPDGLVNFLRGRASEILAELEEHGMVVNNCHDIPVARRVGICSMQCEKGRILRVGYVFAAQTDRLNQKYHCSRLSSELDTFDEQEIENCLKGMMAAYMMYRKQDLHLAPKGYLRTMYYGTHPIRVTWRADILGTREHQSEQL